MKLVNSPYQNLDRKSFWRTAVERRIAFSDTELFRPKSPLTRKTRIATAGSCFAQHVGRNLRSVGMDVLDVELPPKGTDPVLAKDFGYETYSARYGNIYTSAQLLQLLREALRLFEPAEPVWRLKDRFVDSQRPSVEPSGLDSHDEVFWHRQTHLACVLEMMRQCDMFVFTFGLTEAWMHKESRTVFSLAPGTVAGEYDPDRHIFKNYRMGEVVDDFSEFVQLARTLNPDMRFLITVSPVPLAATASGDHVEVATSRSKAVLRAACDELVSAFQCVDYFPSYEIITSQWAKGKYYEPNLRSVTKEGVQTVMTVLMQSYGLIGDEKEEQPILSVSEDSPALDDDAYDIRCEEILLERSIKDAEA